MPTISLAKYGPGIPAVLLQGITPEHPLDELRYVFYVNLDRRHLDEFQRAEIEIKYDKLYRKIASERYEASHFNIETAAEAIKKRHEKEAEENCAT